MTDKKFLNAIKGLNILQQLAYLNRYEKYVLNPKGWQEAMPRRKALHDAIWNQFYKTTGINSLTDEIVYIKNLTKKEAELE